jgi:hypothetical protein
VDKVKESRVCDACFEECVERSGFTLTQYLEKKQQEADATTLGSIKNSIGGIFGRRRSSVESPATSDRMRSASPTIPTRYAESFDLGTKPQIEKRYDQRGARIETSPETTPDKHSDA